MAYNKPGDIIYAAFPFIDVAVTKKRPVIVLSPLNYQKETENFVGIMITTAKDSSWFNDYKIQDLKSTGLHHESYARFKLFTLQNEFVIKALGTLSVKDRKAVFSLASQMIGP